MASVACTLPVLGLCIHTSGSSSVSGTAGCFSLEFRASAVFDRCDARRKQHQQQRRRRRPLRAPCCMSVDVDSEQENVNSQLKSPQEQDEGIPALNPRRGEYPRSDEFDGCFVKLCSVESFFLWFWFRRISIASPVLWGKFSTLALSPWIWVSTCLNLLRCPRLVRTPCLIVVVIPCTLCFRTSC
jgi:hypothetical protein